MMRVLDCPKCHSAAFGVTLTDNIINSLFNKTVNTRTYIELRCRSCGTPQPTMMFVVDLMPEFDRNAYSDGWRRDQDGTV